jgi:hypothetical protein
MTLLTELLMAGHQPRGTDDHPSKGSSTEAGSRSDHQGHHQ